MKQNYKLFNRDISWLFFNERVLTEATKDAVPLMERIRFLSIYSSNLDEFYRVRMPAIKALHKLNKKSKKFQLEVVEDVANKINDIILVQQEAYGQALNAILPQLREHAIHVIYNQSMPDCIVKPVSAYFFSHVLAFLQVVNLSENTSFFPENNKLYLLVVVKPDGQDVPVQLVVNVPSDYLPRFLQVYDHGVDYVVFLDDIIKTNLPKVLSQGAIAGIYSFKVTRDAELEIADEYEGDLADRIERQIEKRDLGLATRLLYQGDMNPTELIALTDSLKFEKATIVKGGNYHNLKDLADLPINNSALSYPKWPAITHSINENELLLNQIEKEDILIHPPYQSYDLVVRFFTEAAINPNVDQIFITIYRVATDSRIANALITAAKNGKEVCVFVELKARFDEANNIKWSKKMKAAGIQIIYSNPSLKVHAKIALIRKRAGEDITYLGILSTGNFNETTARFYTDHVLFTAHPEILPEVESVFSFLQQRKKPTSPDVISFKHLLVAQFNLLPKFIGLIEQEIDNSKNGLPSGITIKLNNLEEDSLITKLYEASNAGVKVKLIIRGICRLVPGVAGMSEHITVTRIVDRYLEHGRIFIFDNNGDTKIYLGSADWMYRNIYRRIEVVFPIYNAVIKEEILSLIDLQLRDNVQAVHISETLHNATLERTSEPLRSQQEIYNVLNSKVSGL